MASLKEPDSYFLRRGDVALTLLRDFQKIVLGNPSLKPLEKDYQNPREDRVKILTFMEEEVHKLRRSYQRMVDHDLQLVQSYVSQTLVKITEKTSDIFNEYLNKFQKNMTAACLSVLNLDNGFSHPNSANIFTQKTDAEANDFVHYPIFHSDFKALVKYLNKNLELKSKFLAECQKQIY